MQFDNNQFSTAQKVSSNTLTFFPTNQNLNSERLVAELSLPTVVQLNKYQQFRNEQNPTAVQFNTLIQTQVPNDRNCFPLNTTFNRTSTNLDSCTTSQPLHFLRTPENSFTNNQAAIFPPIAQQNSQPNISENSNQFPNLFFHGSHQFQSRTEIQTERIPFEHHFNLETTNKSSIKLPPITIPIFNRNPLEYHEWINIFSTLLPNKISLPDTHRIKYLQNLVVGKVKEKTQAHSYDTAYYQIALKELLHTFGDPSIVVNAFVNHLEPWRPNNDYNKQNLVSFASFLKRLVQAFGLFGFQRRLAKRNIDAKGKEKVPQNILIKKRQNIQSHQSVISQHSLISSNL